MRRYYLIDHRVLFLFGYVFYLFTPYFAGTTDAFQGYPGMDLYQGFFQQIPKDKLTAYMIITLSWLPAFYLGHFCYTLCRPYKRTLHTFPASPASHAVSGVAVLLLGVLLLFAFFSRNSIFGNYEVYDSGARGKMSSLLVIFNFFLVYQLLSRQKLSFLLVLGTILTGLLLLAMGGRMYVIQTFIIYLVFKTSFATKRWRISQILVFMFLALFTGAFVGIARMGSSLSGEKAMYSFLSEPVFTWFSTSTFLRSNSIPLFNFPSNFLTSFFNVIPNTVFSLQPYIVSTQDMGYVYENPLGADSIWTTLVINFGAIGSFFFVFLTGFLLNFLRHLSENRRFWAAYYIMICGMLPFQFFRDGFYIVNKQLFFNFLILPAFILGILQSYLYLKKARGPVAIPGPGLQHDPPVN